MPERKVKLISAARHIYAGRPLAPNDHFEATEQDAEDLIALHFAVPDKETEPRPKRTYRRRDMKAES